MESIFIQIASYRDPELIPTIDDLIANAEKSENLTICIAHQHSKEDAWDTLEKYALDGRFIIIDIPHEESQGACWARNQIQQHYNGETYTLQIDSHHRFVKGWDTIAIKMLKNLQAKGHKKPLLTGYIPSYNPKNDPEERHSQPWGMSFDRFTPEGVIFFLPYHIEKPLSEPLPARFYSAHFAFTVGEFSKEVQHDPLFYFHGEEITIGVRAFTHGYDLFHPHKIIAWHEYTREGRTKHWDDHAKWGESNIRAHQRTRMLLGVDGEMCHPCNKGVFKGYDIGDERTIKEYEVYSGIRFKDRTLTDSCIKNRIPPGNLSEIYFPKFKHAIDLNKSFFPENDYTFAALIFENEQNKEIYRQDINKEELDAHLKGPIDSFTVWREYNGYKPHHWVMWPHSEAKGWGDKTIVNL
jgi:hypothetical protein|tara:strand:+ start:10052 stop:11281 length:1230 start_codon:yes stop_codon:yes gene_type:complete